MKTTTWTKASTEHNGQTERIRIQHYKREITFRFELPKSNGKAAREVCLFLTRQEAEAFAQELKDRLEQPCL